jgi:hypothetical protein
MSPYHKLAGSILVGGYAWILSISFGTVLLDILYANQVPEAKTAFSKVADFLLLVNFVSLLSALAAIALSWNVKTARNLFIASLLVSLSQLLIPAFFAPFIQNTPELSIGPWLRIIINAAASILALIGMVKFYKGK